MLRPRYALLIAAGIGALAWTLSGALVIVHGRLLASQVVVWLIIGLLFVMFLATTRLPRR